MIMDKRSRKGKANKITLDYGIKEYYNHYKNTVEENKVSQKLYSKILSEYLSMQKNDLLDNNKFNLPNRLGEINIRKYKPVLHIDEEGNLINKLPVNIIATYNLWQSDAIAAEKRILVRYTNKHSQGFVFKINYDKKVCNFKNKVYYKFHPYRKFKRELVERIKEDRIDAYLL